MLRPLQLVLFFISLLCTMEAVAEQVNSKDVITIAINKTSYPYHFVDENNQPKGLMVDLWKLWAEKQQQKIEFVPLTWLETLAQVESGKIDIHGGLAHTKEREKRFDFSPEFFIQKSYVFINWQLENITEINDLKPYIIGVVKGSGHIKVLANEHPELQVREYDNRHALYDAALAGKIHVFAALDDVSEQYHRHQEMSAQFPQLRKISYSSWPYASAVQNGNTELIKFIADGLAKITHQEKSSVERKWLGLEKDRDSLLLAFSTNLPPYMMISPSGKPQGLFIDLWRLWALKTGRKIEFLPGEMADALHAVKQGQADVHIAYPESSRVNTGLLKAWQLYEVNSQVYVSKRLPDIHSLQQLSGKRIGIFKTAPYKLEIEKQYPQLEIVYFSAIKEAVSAAENGKVDAFIGAVDNINAYLNRVNLAGEFYLLEQPTFYSDIFSLVNSDNQTLADIIESGFEQISTAEYHQLESKWLTNNQNSYFANKDRRVALNQNEKAFLADKPRFTLGYLKGWAPMEFQNEDGEMQGINNDIMALLAKRAGLSIRYQGFDSWNELYQAFLKYEVDFVAGVSKNEERTAYFDFTKAYWKMPWVVVHKESMGKATSMSSFDGKKLAVVKGYNKIAELAEAYPKVQLQIVENVDQGVDAVKQDQVEGFIETIAVASEKIKEQSLIQLDMTVIEELGTEPGLIAIRKDYPQLASVLNKVINTVSESDRQDIIERWFAITINTGLDKNMVLRVTAQIGVFIILVIFFIIIWNRRLQKEVKRRRQLEAKMKYMASHDDLTGLANRVLLKERLNTAINYHHRQNKMLALLFIDLDGFKEINDSYGHDAGDELLVQLADGLEGCVRQSDTVARFGGDEFILLLTNLESKDEAAFIANKVLNIMNKSVDLSVGPVTIGASIGIAMYPENGGSDDELLKVADTLMYQVKAAGKNNFVFTD